MFEMNYFRYLISSIKVVAQIFCYSKTLPLDFFFLLFLFGERSNDSRFSVCRVIKWS